MLSKLQNIAVELKTPRSTVFSGLASLVELRTTDGVIAFKPQAESYLNLTQSTEMTVRCGMDVHRFVLQNAVAGLRNGKLTVLAEDIRAVEIGDSEAASGIR